MAAFDLADWLCPDAPNGRQPQDAYAINVDHPLARSLIYAMHGGEVGRTSMASIMQRSIGPFGAQIGVSSAGYSGDPVVVKDIKAAQCTGLSEYSIFVIFSRVSGPTGAPTIFAETTSGGYGRNMFYYNGGWVWRTRDNTSGDTGSPDELSVVSPVSGAYEKRLFTYGKGAKKAYLNGVLSNSKSLTTSGFTSTDSVGFAVNGSLDNSNTSYGGDSKVALLYMFNRVLTADEARLLSNAPYALLGSPLKSVFLGAAAGSGSTLAIAKIFQSHALDGLTLTAQSDLAVTDANHGNAIGAIGLSASSLLAVGDASHDHLAENVALNTTGSENLIVLDSLHSHVADGVALTTQWLISVADALNSQSLESLTLSLDSHLAVADAGHGHASESMTLGVAGADNLVVSDVLHGQTAEGLALVTEWLLIVTDAAHAQLAESTILSTDALLVVQEASNDHLAENVALDTSDATTLATQGGVQWHTADGITLTLDTWLAIVGAAHAHAADAPTLSTEAALQIAEALHAHYADTVVLSFPGVTTLTPDDISAIAAAVIAALQATTIPVDAVTGAWPTAVENADALLSRTWP